MSEVLLMVKRHGLDKTWQVAPYDLSSRAQAERIAAWLKRVTSAPFDYKVVEV